jgi:iron complex outermembrane receptor protein
VAQTSAAEETPDPGAEEGRPAWEVEPPVSPPPPEIEAIEVTGERINSADVQDEAQAISAFSADDLARANIVNIESLQFNVPGLHVGQTGQTAIVTLRGVGTENATITGEPGVAFHVDGVNFAQPSAARLAFFDLEGLDVKRGPQGLQGGKNSTSGTINVSTRKPHDEYEVTGTFLMGNYDRRRAQGAINVPLGEFVALRTALHYEDRDGFLDNLTRSDDRDGFDVDDFGLRAQARLTPADSLELLLSYNYYQQGGVGPQADLAPISRYFDCDGNRATGVYGSEYLSPLPVIAACGMPVVPPLPPATEEADPRGIYLTFPSSQDTRFWGWTGTFQWDVPELPWLGATRLKGIGGFQSSEVGFLQDFDATDQAFSQFDNNQDIYQHTGELQWSGSGANERLEWQAGSYFARERGGRDLLASNRLQGAPLLVDQDVENVALGASLHTLLHVSDNVRFELGGRWIRDEKGTKLLRYDANRLSGAGPAQVFVGCDGSLEYDPSRPTEPKEQPGWCRHTYRGRMWGTGLDWRPFGGDVLLYAKLDRGYKSGGFRAGTRGEYLPEKIWAYAAGTKSEFFDSRLQLNFEAFAYNYQDMQLVVLDGTTVRTENADTRMYGWDLEAKSTPFEGLELTAVVSFLETEVFDYYTLDPADTRAFSGDVSKIRSGRFDPYAWVETYNVARLEARQAAEDLTEANEPRTYADQTCHPYPEGKSASQFQHKEPCASALVSPFGGLDSFSGNQLSRSPRWKYTLSAGYDIPVGRLGTLTPRVQYTWQDETYFRVFNRSFDLQEDYHLTDVKLQWRSPEERWNAEVFVQNIEDEAPKQNVFVGPRAFGAPPFTWYGPPRFYGVQVGFKY